jgi:hypothetical protein
MNIMGMAEGTDAQSLYDFECLLRRRLDFDLISYADDYIMDAGYFYDSNFHLNDAGAVYHTSNLAYDIAEACGMEILMEYEIPDIPEIPDDVGPEFPTDYDENEKYFVFEERFVSGELRGYNIVGLSELGKTQAALTTPYAYNGMRVYNLKEGAFSGANATEIFVTDNIASIEDGAFAGADLLKKVHVLATNPDSTTVNNLGDPCRGMPVDAKFYVPADSYSTYVSNYFWSPFANRIAAEEVIVDDEVIEEVATIGELEVVIIFAIAITGVLATVFVIEKKKQNKNNKHFDR